MPEFTPNLNLAKPQASEYYDIDITNQNLDKIDTAVKELHDNTAKNADVQNHVNDHLAHTIYGLTGGTGAAYTLNPTPAVVQYKDGLPIAIKIHLANTGPCTINISGLGAIAIKRAGGADLPANYLKKDAIYNLRHNGTNFILSGEGGEYGVVEPWQVLQGVPFGTSDGIKHGEMRDHSELELAYVYPPLADGVPVVGVNPGAYVRPDADGKHKVTLHQPHCVPYNIIEGTTIMEVNGAAKRAAGNIQPSGVLSGFTFSNEAGGPYAGTMPNRSVENHHSPAASFTVWPGDRVFLMPHEGYYNNSWVTTPAPGFKPENIRAGVDIMGITGTMPQGLDAVWATEIAVPETEWRKDIPMMIQIPAHINAKRALFTWKCYFDGGMQDYYFTVNSGTSMSFRGQGGIGQIWVSCWLTDLNGVTPPAGVRPSFIRLNYSTSDYAHRAWSLYSKINVLFLGANGDLPNW
ncbi:hypothetical protein MH117_24520 [Paenibacillus sp. ACRRX]|uniref:hypothetical protein n=1 Tax=Paenibacillus sp. ACRRX TaxID=2918206 RepID=UPI001EF42892|nr:hypothetical protein [Paenibacillus sp. ACRRX]MCG7410565.1 hypothetical protein [Paenibacillus sp. ACRRX]